MHKIKHTKLYNKSTILKCSYQNINISSCVNMLANRIRHDVNVGKSLRRVPLFVTPMDYMVHGILQARILEWGAFPFSRGSSQPRNRPRSLVLQADSLPAELQGKPKNIGVGSLSFSRGSSQPRDQTGVSCTAGGFFSS